MTYDNMNLEVLGVHLTFPQLRNNQLYFITGTRMDATLIIPGATKSGELMTNVDNNLEVFVANPTFPQLRGN